MNRRRTAVVALTAVCAVAALSGCSAAGEHPGAAAIVGNQRIAVATLQADVTAYRTALSKDAGAQEAGSVSGQTLQLLVLAEVVQQTLAERGLSVSEGQVQQDAASDASQAGGAAALAQDFVQQLSLAPSSMDTYYRMRAGELELLQQAGVDPSASDAGSKLQTILAASADRLGVQVNPRYGVWSDQKLALAAPSAPWLKA